MKGFTTIGALLIALASSAQGDFASKQLVPARYQQSKLEVVSQKAPVPISRAVDLTEGAFTDIRTVEGRKVYVTVSGWGFVDNGNGLKPTSFDMASDIVYGDDGFIYLHSPLGGTRSGYVKGVPSEDGKSFTVQYPQIVNTVSAPDQQGNTKYYPVYAGVMECYMEEDDYGEYATYDPIDDPELNLITYSIDENGTVRMDPPLQEKFVIDDRGYVQSPEYLLSEYVTVPAYVVENVSSTFPQTLWLGPGCINVQYNALPQDILPVRVPEDLQWETSWVAKTALGDTYSIRIAFKDHKVYIGGLSRQERVTSDVFMGYVDGQTIVFPPRQFLGYDESNHELIFLMAAVGEKMHDDVYNEDYIGYTFTDKEFEMHYDADKKEISSVEENGALIISASYTRTNYYFTDLYKPLFIDQDNELLNAAPVAPRIIDWENYTSTYGVYMMAVSISAMNVNGALLDESRLYYSIFVDDEPYFFNGEDNGFAHDQDIIPLNAQGKDIFAQGPFRSLYLHITDPKKVGVMSYYLGSDDCYYASRMVELDVSGITDITTEVEPVSRSYFDLTGRQVTDRTKGSFLIEVTTYSDGSKSVKKTSL